MKVLVDTSVWSLALRRGVRLESPLVQELRSLIATDVWQSSARSVRSC
jgi:hypothetical protein